jgi:anti-sigma regulatory factor (Ser/Thr protein kinase)
MCGTISSARQAGGDACHAVRPPGTAVRIPPLPDAQGSDVTGRWPLRSFLELSALPSAVPCARLHTRNLLWEWHLTGLGDSELIVSELVTNAVKISRADERTAPVQLWLLADRARVVILVWDASPLPPVRKDIAEDDENGRGLLLVETLSAQWNWYFPPHPRGGKVIWALVTQLPHDHPVTKAMVAMTLAERTGDDPVRAAPIPRVWPEERDVASCVKSGRS